MIALSGLSIDAAYLRYLTGLLRLRSVQQSIRTSTAVFAKEDISFLHFDYSLGTRCEYLSIPMIVILSAALAGRIDADPEKFSAGDGWGPCLQN